MLSDYYRYTRKLLPHIFNDRLVKSNSDKLIDLFSSLEIPIFCSEQYPKGLGPTVKEIKNKLQTVNAHFLKKPLFHVLIPPN